MDNIFSALRSSLDRRRYSKNMIARLALNKLALLMNKERIDGYLRYSTLHVELTEQSDIIRLFSKKSEYLVQLNQEISQLSSGIVINDLRVARRKSEAPSEDFA